MSVATKSPVSMVPMLRVFRGPRKPSTPYTLPIPVVSQWQVGTWPVNVMVWTTEQWNAIPRRHRPEKARPLDGIGMLLMDIDKD